MTCLGDRRLIVALERNQPTSRDPFLLAQVDNFQTLKVFFNNKKILFFRYLAIEVSTYLKYDFFLHLKYFTFFKRLTKLGRLHSVIFKNNVQEKSTFIIEVILWKSNEHGNPTLNTLNPQKGGLFWRSIGRGGVDLRLNGFWSTALPIFTQINQTWFQMIE